jgi:hypothetical protein
VPAKTARRLTLRDVDLRDIRILPVAPLFEVHSWPRRPHATAFSSHHRPSRSAL